MLLKFFLMLLKPFLILFGLIKFQNPVIPVRTYFLLASWRAMTQVNCYAMSPNVTIKVVIFLSNDQANRQYFSFHTKLIIQCSNVQVNFNKFLPKTQNNPTSVTRQKNIVSPPRF